MSAGRKDSWRVRGERSDRGKPGRKLTARDHHWVVDTACCAQGVPEGTAEDVGMEKLMGGGSAQAAPQTSWCSLSGLRASLTSRGGMVLAVQALGPEKNHDGDVAGNDMANGGQGGQELLSCEVRYGMGSSRTLHRCQRHLIRHGDDTRPLTSSASACMNNRRSSIDNAQHRDPADQARLKEQMVDDSTNVRCAAHTVRCYEGVFRGQPKASLNVTK